MPFAAPTTLALMFVLAAGGGGATVPREVCLLGATLVDPATRTAQKGDVVVRGQTIAAVGPDAGAACRGQRLALAGRFVIPGLIDMHVHGWGNPSPTESGEEDLGHETVLANVLKAGVMATVDLAGNDEKRLRLRDRLRGSRAHAAFYVASALIARPGPDDAAEGEAELRARVRARARLRPDLIKIISAGGPVAPLVAEARALGLKTVVHISSWEQARAALAARASAITHFEDEVTIPDDLVKTWAGPATPAARAWAIPTMVVQCELARLKATPSGLDDPLLMQMTTPALRAAYRDHDHFSARAQKWVSWQTAGCVPHDFPSLQKLHRAGVGLLAGSDTGNLGTFQGYSLHREMELMVEAGVPVWDALVAATSAPAAFLGLDWGLAPGQPANLVVLAASPIEAIGNTRRIVEVIHRGERVPRERRSE